MTIASFLASLGRWTEGPGPVYRRLAHAMRAAVERGEIRAGERLPSERLLAERLALSRTTVVSAYDELRRDRVVESRQGSGTRVAGAASPRTPALLLREDPSGSFRRHPVWRSLTEGHGGTIEFLGAHLPAPDLLAREASRIDEKSLRELSRGPGYIPMGLPALRQAIAATSPRRAGDDGGPGPRDARRAAAIGLAARSSARRETRCSSRTDVSRLDRHLHRTRGRAS
jgi:DNA-binding transcriptional MocR family regulator